MGTTSTASSATATTTFSLSNLLLGDPRCDSDACPAFRAAHDKSQAEVSSYYQYHHGEWLSYACIIVLFFYMVTYAQQRWSYRKKSAPPSLIVTISEKSVAIYRSFTYRRIPGPIGRYLGLPSFGVLTLTLVGLVFILAFSFAIHPYYRRYRGFGSPPLAVRAGLMATALTPWIFALAGKCNFITLLTGISHEKLNVVHRYTSYACLILSIIHTAPYLVIDAAGPTLFGLAGLKARWYAKGSYEFTGTPPFGILVFLSVFSIPYFRHRFYELFKYSHHAAAITYLGLIYWHSGNHGNSWLYLHATVAIFVLSLVGRLILKTSSILGKHWFETKTATVEKLGLSMLKVSIFAPLGVRWSPGQHVFLRFPGIQVFANHPFTIASIPTSNIAEPQEMVFLVRPYKGFTAVLHSISIASPSPDLTLSVDVGGPHGGLRRALEKRYDGAILVAGGGGISAVLPWLLHLSEKMRRGEDCVTREVALFWAVQHADAICWVREQFELATKIAPEGSISIHIFVTRSQKPVQTPAFLGVTGIEKTLREDVEIKDSSSGSTDLWTLEHRRPNFLEILPNVVKLPRTVVLGCGPEGMNIDVANAVASSQKRVLSGNLHELALHTEAFGW